MALNDPTPPASGFDSVNRDLWNRWTPLHASSSFFDVAGFKAGRSSLKEPERELLGDVRGKSIIHLMCHLGVDSLSLARAGARVTAVDYSEASIDFARALAAETGLQARFVCANVYALPEDACGGHDIVFMSYGVLHWLPDLPGLAALVARLLAPDGRFVLVDFHPLLNMLDATGSAFVFPYFGGAQPVATVKRGTCFDDGVPLEHAAYEWPHGLAEIVSAFDGPGLRMTSLREYPYMPFNCLPFLAEAGRGRYAAKRGAVELPLLFSLTARRAAAAGHDGPAEGAR